MKTTPVCLILAALVIQAPLLPGQDRDQDRGPDRGRDRGPAARQAIWDKVDTDRDGAISSEEFARMPRVSELPEEKRQRLFQHLDKNGDGHIDRDEIHKGHPRPMERRPRLPKIWELDRDRDGGVTFEEFQAGEFVRKLEEEKQRRIFSRLDSDGDGRITTKDKPQRRPKPEGPGGPGDHARPDRPNPKGLIEHLDQDGDGAVSQEEFAAGQKLRDLEPEAVRKRFQMMDRNQDGKLDPGDFTRPRPEQD